MSEAVGPEITLSWDAWEAGLEPSSFTVTITFSEAVKGFTLDDISVIRIYPIRRGMASNLLADRESELPGRSRRRRPIASMCDTGPCYVGQVVRAESVLSHL